MFQYLRFDPARQGLLNEERLRRIIQGAILLPIAASVLAGGLFLWQLKSLLEASRWVDHTDRVIAEVHHAERMMIDSQSSFRGYLLSGDPLFLDSLSATRAKIPPIFDELRGLMTDNQLQSTKLVSLRQSYSDWLKYADTEIGKRASTGLIADGEAILQGRALMRAVRQGVDEILRGEEDLRTDRSREAQKSAQMVLYGGVVVITLLGLMFAVQTRRGLMELYREIMGGTERLRRSWEELNVILKGVSEGITVLDRSGHFVYANDIGAQMCGYSNALEMVADDPRHVMERFEVTDEEGKPVPEAELPGRRALMGYSAPAEKIVRFRYRKDPSVERWSIISASPIRDSKGEVQYAISIFRDFTERKNFENNLKRAEEMSRFLSEAGKILSSSLDYQTTLQSVAHLSVPMLADWISIIVVEPSGPKTVAVSHPDPKKREWARELQEKYPPDWNATNGAPQVIRTGKSELYRDIPQELLRKAARDDEHWRMIEELGFTSAMVVPLRYGEQVLGAINFISAESGRRYDIQDLAFAEELGRHAGLALQNARYYADLQKAVQARDEFLSIASHELRTPLTPLKLQIQSLTRALRRSEFDRLEPSRLNKMATTSERQVERLTHLVDDLLDVARISSGRLTLHPEETDISELARELVQRYSGEMSSSHTPVRVEAGGVIRANVDRLRLEQVFANLITNALKYAPGKPVEVKVSRLDGVARISVHDQGPGISEQDQKKIFDRFERVKQVRSVEGLGLGLYISRQIVAAHGGQIRVDSRPGEGTTFIVDIPVNKEPASH